MKAAGQVHLSPLEPRGIDPDKLQFLCQAKRSKLFAAKPRLQVRSLPVAFGKCLFEQGRSHF
jgi:hypothetical protein